MVPKQSCAALTTRCDMVCTERKFAAPAGRRGRGQPRSGELQVSGTLHPQPRALPAPFGTCGTPTVHFQCISSCAPHATPPAPRPGSVGWRRASGAHGGARNAISPISAVTVGARARFLDARAERARTVSMSKRRPSHRPARALEAAAWLATEKRRSGKI
jgi:hypothetical protein